MSILTVIPPSVAGVPAADVWSWLTSQSALANTAAKGVGALLATVFMMVAAWKVRGAIAGIVAGGVTAIIFVFILNNASAPEVQEKVKDTVKGAPRIELPRSEPSRDGRLAALQLQAPPTAAGGGNPGT